MLAERDLEVDALKAVVSKNGKGPSRRKAGKIMRVKGL